MVAVTQLVIGAGMGFLTLVLFAAISAAGSLVDIYGGFQLAAAFDPLSMNTNSVFGRFYEMIKSQGANVSPREVELYLDLPMAQSARARVGTAILTLPRLRTPVTK